MTAAVKAPMAPLVERVAWQLGRKPETLSSKELAAAIGVHTRTVQRWIAAGRMIPIAQCDGLATGLGWHPCMIWGPDWAQE